VFVEDLSGCTTSWTQVPGYATPAYFRDLSGIVHVKGDVMCTGTVGDLSGIFSLPAGYQPEASEHFVESGDGTSTGVLIVTSGGTVEAVHGGTGLSFSFDSISFRCAPSGSNGCP
jgi:hypothetical protein